MFELFINPLLTLCKQRFLVWYWFEHKFGPGDAHTQSILISCSVATGDSFPNTLLKNVLLILIEALSVIFLSFLFFSGDKLNIRIEVWNIYDSGQVTKMVEWEICYLIVYIWCLKQCSVLPLGMLKLVVLRIKFFCPKYPHHGKPKVTFQSM